MYVGSNYKAKLIFSSQGSLELFVLDKWDRMVHSSA